MPTLAETHRFADLYIGQVLPAPVYQSLPIPFNNRSGIEVIYLFGRWEGRTTENSCEIWAPSHVAHFDYATSAFLRLDSMAGTAFRFPPSSDQPIGGGWTNFQKLADEYLSGLIRYMSAVDAILLSGGKSEVIDEHAETVLQLFEKLCEKPLIPYCEIVGSAFFKRLRHVHQSA